MQNNIKTLQKQISLNGMDKSMYSAVVFPASLSALQGKERERMITVTSGRKCCESYMKYNRLGLLVRMLLESSQWYSPVRVLKWRTNTLYSENITEKEYCLDNNTLLKKYVKILNEKVIPSNRLLFRLVPLELPTAGIGYGLLPTVKTQNLKVCNENWKTTFYPVGMLPTPTAIDGGTGRINKSLSPNAKERPTLALCAKMGLLAGLPPRHERQRQEKSRRRNERVGIPQDWSDFPTQSPVCGRNDGLSNKLDGISFSKWRTESIKAYGNAIVPQVAYEIFKAIDEFYK